MRQGVAQSGRVLHLECRCRWFESSHPDQITKEFIMIRYKLFKGHYKNLIQEGIEMYGEDQSSLAWYAKYNWINCSIWAFHNSRTHELDGSYRKK